MLSFFFFFSSRRRHTRFSRDWSSDVCSSDLSSRRGWWKWWRRWKRGWRFQLAVIQLRSGRLGARSRYTLRDAQRRRLVVAGHVGGRRNRPCLRERFGLLDQLGGYACTLLRGLPAALAPRAVGGGWGATAVHVETCASKVMGDANVGNGCEIGKARTLES